jgi:hypothetical protein
VSIQNNPTPTYLERHLSVAELSSLWNLSEDTIRDLFLPEPGVIVIQNPRRRIRIHRTLRIPESVAERVHKRLMNGGRNGNY